MKGIGNVTGPDRRERPRSLLEPLELDELEPRPRAPAESGAEEEDPSVFDRITAIPSVVPEALIAATRKQDDDPISGLHERTEPGLGAPAASIREERPATAETAVTARPPATPPEEGESDSDLPPVLSAPGKRERRRSTRPFRSPSRPTLERAGRRPSTPRQPAAVELELVDVSQDRTEIALASDALEVELPTRGPGGVTTGAPPEAPEVIEMKDRYATGDFSGALVIADGILNNDPFHEDARRYQQRCSETLSQMYLARLGSLTQVVRVAVARDQIRWLSLDHRAGFLLSLVDGTSSIEELLDVSTMPRLEALRILYGLLDQRVIALS
jgi:hypothetical protein